MHRLPYLVPCLLFSLSPALAANFPNLQATGLYTKIAKSCRLSNTASIQPAIRRVFAAAKVGVASGELCNEGTYPIYHVSFRYDPMTVTDSFFLPFYAKISAASTHHPLAFVDARRGEIVELTGKGAEIEPVYEPFNPD